MKGLFGAEDFLKGDKPQPVYKVIENRGIDPLSAFESIERGPYSFLLESIKGGRKTGRYSFLGTDPYLIFKSKGNQIEIEKNGLRSTRFGNPITALKGIFEDFHLPRIDGLPPFFGGAVGFFSYELVHFFETLPKGNIDDLDIPDIFLIFSDTVIAFDHLDNTIMIIFTPQKDRFLSYERKRYLNEAIDKIVTTEGRLLSSGAGIRPAWATIRRTGQMSPVPNLTKTGYMDMVRRCKAYIAAGDIFQANLSQRFSVDIESIDPVEIYRTLRKINPSPFAAYLVMDDVRIVSSSPERLVSLEGKRVETRPIAGTRPRGKDNPEDMILREELITDEKERAEHIMLIDLERNDIGRVCKYGSVAVDELMAVEYYSHVIHIVSNIVGELQNNKDYLDLIRAVFPGGTITGVPKVRCMEIIDELEPVVRGPYTGSAGYISLAGDMDLNIIIRSFIIKNHKAYLQIGAGIVADSDPEREYYETIYKSRALIKTIEAISESECIST
jgi:anthranilate/para-aminobenzoate synthase component I